MNIPQECKEWAKQQKADQSKDLARLRMEWTLDQLNTRLANISGMPLWVRSLVYFGLFGDEDPK